MLTWLVGMHAMSPKWFNFYGFKSEEVLIIQSGKFGWTHQAFQKLIAMCVGSIIEDGSAILYKPETWAWPSKIEWNVYSNHYNVYYIYIYITSNFKLVVLLSFSGRMNLSKCLFPACISIVKTRGYHVISLFMAIDSWNWWSTSINNPICGAGRCPTSRYTNGHVQVLMVSPWVWIPPRWGQSH